MSVATFFKAGARGLRAAGDAFTSGVRALGGQATSAQKNFVELLRSSEAVRNAALVTIVNQAGQVVAVFKKMPDGTLKKFDDALTPAGRQKIIDGLKAAGEFDEAKRFEDLSDAAKRSEDAATNLAKQGDTVQIRMPDGTVQSAKYGSKQFWSLVQTGVMVGAGAGLLMWIDKKFEKEKEDYKNCMSGCLPHNWDEYDYGDLQKSDLQYSTPETLEQYQITPIEGQPYCRATIEDCEGYCDERCEEESEARIPILDPMRDLTERGAEGLGDIFKALFGGLFEGMGLDTSMVGYASSASSCMMFMVMMIMLLK
jgi:hypothetical protein